MLQITVKHVNDHWEATALLMDGTKITDNHNTLKKAITRVLDRIAEETVDAATRFVLAT